MRRKMMRMVAMLLAAVMLVTGLPMEAFARETDPVGMTENTANDDAGNENSELMEQYEKLRLAHEQEMMEEYQSELEKKYEEHEKQYLEQNEVFSDNTSGEEQLSGNYKGLEWSVTTEGVLTISGTATEPFETDYDWDGWINYVEKYNSIPIKKVIVDITSAENINSLDHWFHDGHRINEINFININTSTVTDMSGMFSNCNKLQQLDVSKFDTSNVTDMSEMFNGCASLQQLDVSKLDTGKVTDMSDMFNDCISLQQLDLSKFDTSKVTDMSTMFYGCSSLQQLNLSKFDTSNVTDMMYMFANCKSLQHLDLSRFDTSKATQMGGMFFGCNNLQQLDVSKFDTSNVRHMSAMFFGCDNLQQLDLSQFDTSKVNDMSDMFFGCDNLQQLDVSGFDMSKVWNADKMLYHVDNLQMIKTPKNLTQSVKFIRRHEDYDTNKLDVAFSMYDSTGKEYTELPKNMNTSITLTRKADGSGDDDDSGDDDSGDDDSGDDDSGDDDSGDDEGEDIVLDEYKVIESNEVIIKVVDKNKKPIEKASIAYRNVCFPTNKDGIVKLEDYKSDQELPLSISANGYATRNIKKFKRNESGVHVYTLNDQFSSILFCLNGKETDILNTTKTINVLNKSTLFDLKVDCVYPHVLQMYLYAENENGKLRQIGVSNGRGGGEFTNLRYGSFKNGEKAILKGYNTSHNQIFEYELNLDIIYNDSKPSSLSVGNGCKIVIGSDVPIIGGAELKISLEDLPFTYTEEKGKGKIVIGKEFYKMFKQKQEEGDEEGFFSLVKKINRKNYDQFLQCWKDKKPYDDGKKKKNIKFDWDINGCLEAPVNYTSGIYIGKIIVEGSVKYSKENQRSIVGIPVVIELSITGKINAEGKLEWSVAEGFAGNLLVGGGIDVCLYGGVGVARLASGGVYGGGELNIEFQLLPVELQKITECYLEGKAGVRVKAFGKTVGDLKLLNGKYYIVKKDTSRYSKNGSDFVIDYDAVYPEALQGSYSPDSWNNNTVYSDGKLTENVLLNSVCAEIDPQVVQTNDGVTLMAYLNDMDNRANGNRSTLVFHIYDSVNDTWGVPVAVNDNGTADFNPDIYSDGQDIYAVWQDAATALTSNMTLNQIADSLNLTVAKYNKQNGTFDVIGSIKDEQSTLLKQKPQIASKDGKLKVFWHENETDNVLGLSGTNVFYSAELLDAADNTQVLGEIITEENITEENITEENITEENITEESGISEQVPVEATEASDKAQEESSEESNKASDVSQDNSDEVDVDASVQNATEKLMLNKATNLDADAKDNIPSEEENVSEEENSSDGEENTSEEKEYTSAEEENTSEEEENTSADKENNPEEEENIPDENTSKEAVEEECVASEPETDESFEESENQLISEETEESISENTASYGQWKINCIGQTDHAVLSSDAGIYKNRICYAEASGTLDRDLNVEYAEITLRNDSDSSMVGRGNATNVCFEKLYGQATLTWYDQGDICYLDNEGSVQNLFGEGLLSGVDYKLLDDANGNPMLVFAQTGNDRSELYRIDYRQGEGFLAPLPISSQEQYIQHVDGFRSKTGWNLVYNIMTVEDLEEKSNILCFGKLDTDIHDVALKQLSCLDYRSEEKGEQILQVYLTVCNEGTKDIDRLSLSIKDANGKEVASRELQCDLKPGDSTVLTDEIPYSLLNTKGIYSWELLPIEGETVTNNNSQQLELGGSCLNVITDVIKVGAYEMLQIAVCNSGLEESGGKLRITDYDNGTEYLVKEFDAIGFGQSRVFSCDEMKSVFEKNQSVNLMVEVIPNVEQENTSILTDVLTINAPAFTVSFLADGYEPVYVHDIRYGDTVAFPENPKKDGSCFAGWYSEDGELYTEETKITKDVELKAKWQDKQTAIAMSQCSVMPIAVQYYNGKALKPAVTVKNGSVPLKLGKDYQVSYSDNVNQGVGTVTITGKGIYSGTISRKFDICYDISKAVAGKLSSYKYTGAEIKPEPVLEFNKQKLVNGTDYSLSYGGNKAAGTACITVNGKGKYRGSLDIYFTIEGIELSKLNFAKLLPMQYSESGSRPDIKITDNNGVTLEQGTDYFLIYQNTEKLGTATVIAIGMGNYSGSKVLTYKIVPADISKAKITVADASVYTGKPVKAKTKVTYGDTLLEENKDYTVSFKNNTKSGVATMLLTGKGNYKGTVKQAFRIEQCSLLDNPKVKVDVEDMAYTGNALKPKVTVICGDRVLTAKDYTVTYENNSDMGIGIAVIEGKGNYKGTLKTEFRIVDKSQLISGFKVSKISDMVFDVKPLTPDVQIFDGDKRLAKDKDYVLSYAKNDRAGKATVTVKGIGAYAGVKKLSFKITPKDLADKFGSKNADITVASIKKMLYTGYALKPSVEVSDKKEALTVGRDYTISYKNNKKPGTAKAIITGKGNYRGKLAVGFEIASFQFDDLQISIADQEYSGKAVKPTPTFILNGEEIKLKAGTAYTMTCKDNKQVGNAQAVIQGKGVFAQAKPVTLHFTIDSKDLKAAVIGNIPNQKYRGKPVQPIPKVKVGKTVLKYNKDFKVSYYRNGRKGEATMVITGIGNYTGSCEKSFIIM